MKNNIAVVALGGNAILQAGERGTREEQYDNVKIAAAQIVENMVENGYTLVLTHGNGPQVGNLYIQDSLAGEAVPPMPLDVLLAESQGLIGYFMQQAMHNELANRNIDIPVLTIITQVEVEEDDPAFENPTKPIGPFHTKREAELLMATTSIRMKVDSLKRWRKVVPSPKPIRIVEGEAIKASIEDEIIVIVSGGGGIPVIRKDNELVGVEAVLDKDLSACRLAIDIGADILTILTDVDGVALNFQTPDEKWIDSMTVEEAKGYIAEGHFKEGSMKPKVEAAVSFVENGGDKSVIGSLNPASSSTNGKSGTTITK